MHEFEGKVWIMLLTRLQDKSVTFNIQLTLFVAMLKPEILERIPTLLDAMQPG